MTKVAGMIMAMVMMSVLLVGCYSKSCEQHSSAAQYKDMKGEKGEG